MAKIIIETPVFYRETKSAPALQLLKFNPLTGYIEAVDFMSTVPHDIKCINLVSTSLTFKSDFALNHGGEVSPDCKNVMQYLSDLWIIDYDKYSDTYTVEGEKSAVI